MEKEYHRYIYSLTLDTASEDVLKIANLVKNYFADLVTLGTYMGKRSQKFIEIAQREFQAVSSTIEARQPSQAVTDNKVSRLKSMKVGPFRGFANEESFDLDSEIVLLYGPNGSGKSSFCEALEYGLLGSVEEAQTRRFSGNDYFAHAHNQQFERPQLQARYEDQSIQDISPDEESFRFCFVEKNRIDNFSRMAAKLPAEQSRLIGSLFGLESFQDFVKGFSTELDGKYIDLVGLLAKELAEKRTALQTAELNVNNGPEGLNNLVIQENKVAELWQPGKTYDQMLSHLGSSEQPGRIQELEQIFESLIPAKFGLLRAELEIKKIELKNHERQIKELGETLADQKGKISFRNLFQAVQELQPTYPDTCPACQTPLSGLTSVKENPYVRAESGLQTLAFLAEIETNLESKKVALAELHEYFKSAIKNALTFTVSMDKDVALPELKFFQDNHWELLLSVAADIEQFDTSVQLQENQRSQLKEELESLRGLRDQTISLKTKRSDFENTLKNSRKNILDFEEENKVLIQEVEDEKSILVLNKAISRAYTEFVASLTNYKNDLPNKLLADLESKIVDLYNSFNRSDNPDDQLAKIKVPLSSGERIKISFKGNSSVFFDALHILSEGHVRCVGLAILLAKNLKENCSLLIFDDPVNAIDDDHREAIRRTIFEDEYFKSKQIILTCHGEEFFKDIQNLLGAKRAEKIKKFTFLPQSGENHIQINHSSSPRNYVLASKEKLAKSEVRSALADARRALEFLANDTWRFLHKHCDAKLSIKLRSSKDKPELRNLVEQIKARIEKSDFVNDKKVPINAALNSLLGYPGESPEWRYFNKGTHEEEDRTEFDRATVVGIISSLESLDAALKT